jgi:hypothetical protein
MLFRCLPSDAQIPGRFPGPSHPRGRHYTVDIHCHVLTESAETMFRAAGLVERRPRDVFANHARATSTNNSPNELVFSLHRSKSGSPTWT